mgnify:CR=1 FL=1
MNEGEQNNFIQEKQDQFINKSKQLTNSLTTHEKVLRSAMPGLTSIGAGFLAGLAVGVWESPQAISDAWQVDQQFLPQLHTSDIETYKRVWARAVQKALP